MAAVAVVALLAAASVTLARRAARFRELAAYHGKQTEGVSGIFYGHELDRLILTDVRTGGPLPRLDAARFLWHCRLRAMYTRAASRPWLPVGADAPEPSGDAEGDLVALGEDVFFTARTETVEMILGYLKERAPDYPELRVIADQRRYLERHGGWYFDSLSPDALRLLGRLMDEMAEELPAVAARANAIEGRKAVDFADVDRFRRKLDEAIDAL